MVQSSVSERVWLEALATFTFDLDVGQKAENVYPEDALSPEEVKRIAYISLPVRMSDCILCVYSRVFVLYIAEHGRACMPGYATPRWIRRTAR